MMQSIAKLSVDTHTASVYDMASRRTRHLCCVHSKHVMTQYASSAVCAHLVILTQ